MPQALAQFLSRIEEIRAGRDAALQLTPPGNSALGGVDPRKAIRNGLCIVAFASLEDFICTRCFEIVSHLDANIIKFDQLPKKLRFQSTSYAVKKLPTAAKLVPKGSRMKYFAEESAVIGTAGSSQYQISRLAFLPYGANVSAEDVSAYMSCFTVSDAWKSLTTVTRRIGFGHLDARTVFTDFANNRHSAAHEPSTDVQPSDLNTFIDFAMAFAIGFDILATVGQWTGIVRDNGFNCTSPDRVPLRFLDVDSNDVVSERAEGAKRVFRKFTDRTTAVQEALSRAKRQRGVVVERDSRSIPQNWYNPLI